jgi:hypothetical protein
MVWLKQVFKRYTKLIRATIKRILIVNGHLSYVNMEFIN